MFKDFISLLFPSCCCTCTSPLVEGEHLFCTQCIYEFPKTGYHQGKPNTLKQKFYGRMKLEQALSYLKFFKKGKVQKLLHKLKYENYPEIGYELGKNYGLKLYNEGINKSWDLILPVPLHKSKKRQRGYNQSDHFAQGLSDSMQIPWTADALVRLKRSSTQTRKSRMERWQNVEKIFHVTNPELIQGKRILLVDDIVTTGATLEACLQVLHSSGASALSIATIAEAQH